MHYSRLLPARCAGAKAEGCSDHSPVADALKSQGKNTPFLGLELPGRVRYTLVGGRVVFEG